jgi:hypothetical protein
MSKWVEKYTAYICNKKKNREHEPKTKEDGKCVPKSDITT